MPRDWSRQSARIANDPGSPLPGLLSGLDERDRQLWALSVVGGVLYLIITFDLPYPGRAILKALGVGAMTAIAFRRYLKDRTGGALLLTLALALSCLGDIFLALRGKGWFVYGLGSFLFAHLVYIALYIRNWQRPLRPSAGRLLISVLVLLFSLFFSSWLSPSLGGLALPVSIYICAITSMVVSSLWADFRSQIVAVGALLFMISDSILAANKFRMEIPLSGFLVWTTYYVGQYAIAFGYLRERSGKVVNS